MKKIIHIIIICAISNIVFIFSSCNNDEIYNSYIALPNKGWGVDSLAVFRTQIDDTSIPYDLSIQIRNENSYPYANLWLFIDVVAPDGKMTRDTLECILAYPDGRWLGGGWGSLYTLQCPYRENTHFVLPGSYTFRISHGMRENDIKGIHSLGLRIEKKQNNE